MKTTVSLVQFEVKLNSFEESFKKAENFIKQAVEEKAKFICFPENFISGALDYYLDDEEKVNYIVNKLPTIYKDRFKKFSKKYSITIIAGTIYERTGNKKVVNRSYIFKSGKIIYSYDKINLYSSEKEIISSGTKLPTVINVMGVKIAVSVCKDLFDSKIYCYLSKKGAKIVFVPSYWSANITDYEIFKERLSRYKRRFLANIVTKTLAEARAIENGFYLVFANCCGSVKLKNYYDLLMGKSFIASPLEGITYKTSFLKKEVILTGNLNLQAKEDSRVIYDL